MAKHKNMQNIGMFWASMLTLYFIVIIRQIGSAHVPWWYEEVSSS